IDPGVGRSHLEWARRRSNAERSAIALFPRRGVMRSPRTVTTMLMSVIWVWLAPVIPAAAGQEPTGRPEASRADAAATTGGRFQSLADLETSYQQQSTELERKKLADLIALAEH